MSTLRILGTALVLAFGSQPIQSARAAESAVVTPLMLQQLADVFVITYGGLGSIGLKSAERFGEVIEFDLAKPLCLEGGPNLANTTFFFGLAADTPSMATSAQIFSSGNPPLYSVDARVPSH